MNDLSEAARILFAVIKIVMIIFAFLHLGAYIVVWRQAKLAFNTVATKSRRSLMLVLSIHAIVLLLVLITIVILPS